MTFRSKVLLAQAPLVVALAVSGAVGSAVAVSLGAGSRRILEDNYRSALAAQRMAEAVERMDSGAVFAALGRRDEGFAQLDAHRPRFENELRVQEGNITEPGEREATARLRAAWTGYMAKVDLLRATPERGAAESFYFGELLPAFTAVKREIDTVLEMNQDAMVLKSDLADRAARRYRATLLWVALGGCLLALAASSALTARLLRPVGVLAQAARRLGEGDLAARARVPGDDEIARLAAEFNTMAESLQRYRASSLGELLEAQSASQAAIDSLPDPVVVVALDGRLTHVNRAADELLGISLDARGGDPFAAIAPDLRAALDRVRQHVLGGKGAWVPRGLDEAVRALTREGERHLLPRATPVYTEEGGVAGTTIVLQDVTRLLRIEELKNDLVATVAHEFRTPLTSLRMAIHLLVERVVGPLTEKQADLLHAAREDCERLQATVEELLDLSRIQAGRMQIRAAPLDAEAILAAALDASRGAAAQRGIALRAEVLPDVGSVAADADRVQVVFANLLANAIRHAPQGSAVVVRAHAAGGHVRFEVADRGPGVPHEYREAIFQKYFQMPGQPSGSTGLGLYIAKEIVEAHGGRIGVESEPGAGSTFWVELPRPSGDAAT